VDLGEQVLRGEGGDVTPDRQLADAEQFGQLLDPDGAFAAKLVHHPFMALQAEQPLVGHGTSPPVFESECLRTIVFEP